MKQILLVLLIGLILVPVASQAKTTSANSLDTKQEISKLKKEIKVIQAQLSTLEKKLKKEKKTTNSSLNKSEKMKLVSEKEGILKEQITLRIYLDSCNSMCGTSPYLKRNEELNKRLYEIDKTLGTSSFTCSYEASHGMNGLFRSCGG